MELDVRQTTMLKRREQLLADLMSDDEIGVILRSRLWVERELVEFIEARLVDPSALSQKMDFDDRVRLALALGLDPP